MWYINRTILFVLDSKTQVQDFLTANYAASGNEGAPEVVSVVLDGNTVRVKTNATNRTMLMGVFGTSYTNLGAEAGVAADQDETTEIALVLDTTFSMTDDSSASIATIDPNGVYLPPDTTKIDKMTALKIAALKFNALIFSDPASAAKRRIAVVPFSRYVNVGIGRRNEPWMSVPEDSPASSQQCSAPYYHIVSYSNDCHPASYTYDGVVVNYNECAPVYSNTKTQDCWHVGQWNGCVGSRNEPNNLKQAYSSTKFPGIMDVWCGTEVLPLSSDKAAVAGQISSLSANDLTYIPEGVMWGWRMLTAAAPFTEAKNSTSSEPVHKIMLIMTDGENQASADIPTAPTHNSNNFGQADDWTSQACAEAKADKVEIYSVTFGTAISPTAKQIIGNCATDSSHYYDAASAEKLISAFQSIATKVGALRLTN